MNTETSGLAMDLGRLARAMESDTDETGVLQRVVQAALREVPGAQSAGITLVSKQSASTPVSTDDDLVTKVDVWQHEVGQGPCLDAAAQHPIVRSDDLQRESRWPQFVPRALELGVRSVLSFQLFVHAGTAGALNLYARTSHAFGDDAEHIGTPLAAHAAVALAATRNEAELRIALDSRDRIGQAKGILMERYKITPEEAFDLLIEASQSANRKLRDVADELAATGELAAREA